MGIGRLMRLEERIVLDGAVVADAADHADPADAPDAAMEPQHVDDAPSIAPDAPADADNAPDADQDSGSDADEAHAVYSKALIINDDISDAEGLAASALSDTLTFVYDGSNDSLQEILDGFAAASGNSKFESIAIATHGQDLGQLVLTDSETASLSALGTDADMQNFFAGIGQMLFDDGRLDLISCDTAQGEVGQELLAEISELTGSDVAGSTDLTGNITKGGDWVLEFSTDGDSVDLIGTYFDDVSIDNYYSLLPAVPAGTFAGGDGSELNPFQISTIEQLQAIDDPAYLDQGYHFVLINDIDASATATWNQESADEDGDGIANEYYGFNPLGYDGNSDGGYSDPVDVTFNGTIDGAGHTIYGLSINRDHEEYVGLVAYLNGGTIKNLMIDAVPAGADTFVDGGTYTGTLAGAAYNAMISDCYAISDVSGQSKVGGLVGSLESGSVIDHGVWEGSLYAQLDNAGGLVGYATSSTVTYSYAEGTVESDYAYFTGGLIGLASNMAAAITNCGVGGFVIGGSSIGGLVGSLSNTDVSQCYVAADVTASFENSGGLFGSITSGTVSESFFVGNVLLSSGTSSGGLAGLATGGVGIYNCYAKATVVGISETGGLIGQSDGCTVSDCYSAGSVSGADKVGGLIGYMIGGSVSSSFASAIVTSGGSYTGGLVGKALSSASFTNSYASGTVFSSTQPSLVGGFLGYNDNTCSFTSCYYSSTQPNLSPLPGIASGTPSAEVTPYAGLAGYDSSILNWSDYAWYPLVNSYLPELTWILPTEQPSTIVTTTLDVVSDYDGVTSLREAVMNANSGDTVAFAPGLAGSTIYLTQGEINVSESMVISAAGLNITIDGGLLWSDINNDGLINPDESASVDAGSGSRIFYVYNYDSDIDVVFDGLKLVNGNAESMDNMDYGSGGLIYNAGEKVNVINSTLQAGYAMYGGGAIYSASNSDLIITGSFIAGNFAYGPGGAIYASDSLAVTGSSFVANKTSSGSGGAIYMTQSYTGGEIAADFDLYLSSLHFANNIGVGGGGAVAVQAVMASPESFISFHDIIFSGNMTTSETSEGGGAILMSQVMGTGVEFSDLVFTGNASETTGGAIAMYDVDAVSMKQVSLSGNAAYAAGALFYTYYQDAGRGGDSQPIPVDGQPVSADEQPAGSFKAIDLIVTGNSAESVSALEFYGGNIAIGNSLIACNFSELGGAVNIGGEFTKGYLFNNTIVGNETDDTEGVGGAVNVFDQASVDLVNDLFYHNEMDVTIAEGSNVRISNSIVEAAALVHAEDGGGNITNLAESPVNETVVDGTWNFTPSPATYDPATGTTTLKCSAPLGVEDNALKGFILITNTDSEDEGYMIVGNTADSIIFLGRVADTSVSAELQESFNYLTGSEGFSVKDPRPSASSAARDAGDNNQPGVSELSTDLWGENRIYNGTIDIGAYEYTPLPTPEPEPEPQQTVVDHHTSSTDPSADFGGGDADDAGGAGDAGGVPADPIGDVVSQIISDIFGDEGAGGTGDAGFDLFNEAMGDVGGMDGDAAAEGEAAEGEAADDGEAADGEAADGEAAAEGGNAAGAANDADANRGRAGGDEGGNGATGRAANRGGADTAGGEGAGPIGNFFSDAISSNQIVDSFSNSFDTFSSLSGQGGRIGSLANQALGASATTAALSLRVSSLLSSLSGKLGAGMQYELEGMAFAEDGDGFTAEAGANPLQRITARYVSDLVKARGDSLRANEMLRKVADGLKANSDRLSVDVFSGCMRELMACNEQTVVAYEKLNAVLKAAKSIDPGTDAAVIESELISVAADASEKIQDKLELLNSKRDRMAEDATVSRIKNMEIAVRKVASDDVAAKRTALKGILQNWSGLEVMSEPTKEIPSFTYADIASESQTELAAK